jgi:hypothetical protein
MSCGIPMAVEFVMEIREIVRTAAGPEICAAIDAAFAIDPCEGMTPQERVDWIVGAE